MALMAEGLYFPALHAITSIHPRLMSIKPAAASSTSHTKGRVAALPWHRTGKGELFLFWGCMAHCVCPVAPWALDRALATSPAMPAPAALDRFQLIIQMYSNPVHETQSTGLCWHRGEAICACYLTDRGWVPHLFSRGDRAITPLSCHSQILSDPKPQKSLPGV